MSTTKPISPERLTVEEIIFSLRENKNKLSTMEAEARIAIDTKEMAQMGASYIKIEMPSSIEMSIRGPLGLPLVEMKAGSSHYSLRDFLRQDFIEGTPDDLSFLGIPFNEGLNELLELIKNGQGQYLNSKAWNMLYSHGLLIPKEPKEAPNPDGQKIFIQTNILITDNFSWNELNPHKFHFFSFFFLFFKIVFNLGSILFIIKFSAELGSLYILL